MNALRIATCLLALALPVVALAQATPPPKASPTAVAAPLPPWEQLTPEQRETLIAPLRERWNASPDDRARMLDHARRWKSMPPEERERARRGMHRFEQLSPEQREQARAIFEQTRGMSPDQRREFRERWGRMTPELLSALLELPQLKFLRFAGAQVEDDDLAIVARHPSIEEVRIGTVNTTDAGLLKLAALKSLRKIGFDLAGAVKPKISPEGITAFRKLRPDVEVLKGASM